MDEKINLTGQHRKTEGSSRQIGSSGPAGSGRF